MAGCDPVAERTRNFAAGPAHSNRRTLFSAAAAATAAAPSAAAGTPPQRLRACLPLRAAQHRLFLRRCKRG